MAPASYVRKVVWSATAQYANYVPLERFLEMGVHMSLAALNWNRFISISVATA